MAVTTAIKRACLDDAWDETQNAENQSLRDTLRSHETTSRKIIAGGSLASVGANGRSSAFSGYGPGQITPVEAVEIWRDLIDRHDQSKLWIASCIFYGYDPAATELTGWPPGVPVPSPLPAVDDATIYAWMMSHLVAITEMRSDYSRILTGGGMSWV